MEPDEYNALLDRARELPDASVYRNTPAVVTIDGVGLNMFRTVQAALLKNLNILNIGERGEGKTQLQKEVGRMYDGNVTYIRLDDSFREEDIYLGFDLGLLRNGEGTTQDAKKVVGKVDNPLTVIDELTNAHERIQNRTYGIWDREVQDRKGGAVRLGREFLPNTTYHVTMAGANVGSTRYFNTSAIAPALLDRAHLIINTDNHIPGALDLAQILMNAQTPTAVAPRNGDLTEMIVELAKDMLGMQFSLDGNVTLLYLKKSFDYCVKSKSADKSKQSVIAALPRICAGCNSLGDGCGYTLPISTRSAIVTALLAPGLKVMGDAVSGFKAKDDDDTRVTVEHVLAAYQLTAPYGGILDQTWVDEQYNGNHWHAMETIVKDRIRPDLIGDAQKPGKQDVLNKAFGEAMSGRLTQATKDEFKLRWEWMQQILDSFNLAAVKHGDLTDKEEEDLEKIAKEYPIVRWML